MSKFLLLMKMSSYNQKLQDTLVNESQFFMQNKSNRLHVISCTVVIDKLYIHECIFKRTSKRFIFSQKSRKCPSQKHVLLNVNF